MENPTVLDSFLVFEKECFLYVVKLSQGKKNAYLYVTESRNLKFFTILLDSKKNAWFIQLNFHKPRNLHIYI